MLAPAVNNQPDPPTATMLGELAYESERVVDLASLTARVVAGYASAGIVLDPRRLSLDSAAKRLAKVARSACAAARTGRRGWPVIWSRSRACWRRSQIR